ncbi:MAG: 4-carboxymuconolactone decarboxylase [Actinomycetota bacterium]|jgi:alkylhydroperoxidase family enzyme
MEPRIAPITDAETDERTKEVLAGLGAPLNIFTTLAHHPKLLKRWGAFGGTLLYGGELPERDREILILRTGWNCQSEYEWGQHKIIGIRAGLTDDEVVATTRDPSAGGWSAADALLVAAADELHGDSMISDDTWDALAARYSKKQLIEILMTVGQYHLVSMTLNSLRVQRDDGVEGFPS